MKVILKEDVKGLGKKEQLVDVSDGYARNFLIPRNIAVPATATNMNIMQTRNAADKAKKDRELTGAKELAEKLGALTVEVKTKAGENGRLFGSVTNMDIADSLKKNHKLDVDKKKIVISEPIKSIGTTEVEVKLHPGVSAKLKVNITNL